MPGQTPLLATSTEIHPMSSDGKRQSLLTTEGMSRAPNRAMLRAVGFMAMARLNIPSIFVYGGSILPGVGPEGKEIDIVSIFESVGQFQAGKLDAKGVQHVECEACPGAGSCGGMYTANTMSSAIEAMGMSLPFDASKPAVSAAKGRGTVLARPGLGR